MDDSDNKFDGILLKMVEDSKGYEGFFDLVFSMLRRKTDFFSHKQVAEKIIAETGKKHILKFMEDSKKQEEAKASREQRAQTKTKTGGRGRGRGRARGKGRNDDINELRRKAQEEVEKQRRADKLAKEEKTGNEEPEEVNELPKFKVTGKVKPNDMNGGDTETYSWGQTLDQVDVNLIIESGVKAKELIVELKTHSVKVARKDGSKTYLEGEWVEKINADDSFWTLESGKDHKTLVMNITKKPNQDKWWESVIKGGKKIDTGKVNPESSKLSDLDGEMRGEVEKMMFDMRQKQMGKPQSEELKKREMLEKVMKANPNMNFDLSNARFN